MKNGWRRRVGIGLGLCGVLVSSHAHADAAAAEALFEEGVALAGRGQLNLACRKFEASEALDIAVGTLLRLADCYERTGRLASAWSRFREAASLAQSQGMTERQRIATIRADALIHRVARITITVPERLPPGYQVQLGTMSVPAVSWSSPLPVDAGAYLLRATAPGYRDFQQQVTVPASDSVRVDVTIPALVPQASLEATGEAGPQVARVVTVRSAAPVQPDRSSAPAPRSSDHSYAARVAGITLVTLGGIGLATGGTLGWIAKKRSDAAGEHCGGEDGCDARGRELDREARHLRQAAIISAASSGGLLLGGLVLIWAAPAPPGRAGVSLTVTPQIGAGRLALQARARF